MIVVVMFAGAVTISLELADNPGIGPMPGSREKAGNWAGAGRQNVFGKSQLERAFTVVDAATVTLDLSQSQFFVWTIAAAGRTLANPINMPATGQFTSFFLRITAGASGTITTYGSAWKFSGGTKPTFSTSNYDVLSCVAYQAAEIDCNAVTNFQ
jgi:hypothetical protein